MELWKMSQKVSELSDVIPYYFFSLVSSCLSLSTMMVILSEGSWGGAWHYRVFFLCRYPLFIICCSGTGPFQ